MASQQDLSFKAGETVGQAQVKKDETGEQVKSMAQGAAEAVKNTLGMKTDTDTTTSPNNNPTNNPSPTI
ncbi:hypothetical protein SDJN02_24295, partial [Cucurbita argyrosperma subsp. argyrosperma]